jgi:hypothetical protein
MCQINIHVLFTCEELRRNDSISVGNFKESIHFAD